MISKHQRVWYSSIGAVALIMACTCAPLSNIGSSSSDNFPLTPDPVAVQITLDTEHAASNERWATPGLTMNFSVDGETADGTAFSLFMPGALLAENTDGDLIPAFGSAVTVTPISAIDGLPFSQGYLAAVHIGPEGLSMVEPAYLSLTIPGEYNPTDLIGFAADGTGEDFHLFPAFIDPDDYSHVTYVSFNVTHYSLYGVALATAQEILAQQAHPPADAGSQDEDELAPLVRIPNNEDELVPLASKLQLQLARSHKRTVESVINGLSKIKCSQVSTVGQAFNRWKAQVESANQGDYFAKQIQQDARAILDRLNECLKVSCSTCLSPAAGQKPNQAAVNSFLVMATYAEYMANVLNLSDEATYWRMLADRCAEEGGAPPLVVHTGGDCDQNCATAIPTPACP